MVFFTYFLLFFCEDVFFACSQIFNCIYYSSLTFPYVFLGVHSYKIITVGQKDCILTSIKVDVFSTPCVGILSLRTLGSRQNQLFVTGNSAELTVCSFLSAGWNQEEMRLSTLGICFLSSWVFSFSFCLLFASIWIFFTKLTYRTSSRQFPFEQKTTAVNPVENFEKIEIKSEQILRKFVWKNAK